MLPLLLLHLLLPASLPTADQIPPIPQKPIDRTTGTACGLYARPSTQARMLCIVPSGRPVQVVDSSNNAHFVWAQFSKEGKLLSGYMYRACLSTTP